MYHSRKGTVYVFFTKIFTPVQLLPNYRRKVDQCWVSYRKRRNSELDKRFCDSRLILFFSFIFGNENSLNRN